MLLNTCKFFKGTTYLANNEGVSRLLSTLFTFQGTCIIEPVETPCPLDRHQNICKHRVKAIRLLETGINYKGSRSFITLMYPEFKITLEIVFFGFLTVLTTTISI